MVKIFLVMAGVCFIRVAAHAQADMNSAGNNRS